MADYLAGTETESTTVSNLITGDQDIVTLPGTVITGQNLAAGAVVGRIAASGKLTIAALGASDGSQVAYGILAHAVDATSADKAGVVYVGGCFNPDALTWGGTFDTALKKSLAFDGSNITLRAPGNSL